MSRFLHSLTNGDDKIPFRFRPFPSTPVFSPAPHSSLPHSYPGRAVLDSPVTPLACKMEYQQNLYHYYRRFPPSRGRVPPVRWVKQWIPQELAATGGKCSLFRWVREDMVQTLKEKEKAQELEAAPKPEPTTEVLFLCSYDGCGKTFTDVATLRKHSNIHGERQHVCHYTGCGKKFGDSSKLKRHFLVHTGERDFVCPYEGCGKAFALDFNLRAHMKTHLVEYYHVCPYPECGKRYTNEYKLTIHIKAQLEKGISIEAVKHTPPAEKPQTTPRTPASLVYSGPATPARPYGCPYKGCDKAYIHEYKLNLHLKREHPNHVSEELDSNNKKFNVNNGSSKKFATPSPINSLTMGEGSRKEKNRPNLQAQMVPAKAVDVNQKISEFGLGPRTKIGVKQVWIGKEVYEEEEQEEDSEETEDAEEKGGRNGGIGWGYSVGRNGDDEETEDED
ncbi:C2H2 type zinc finger protein [Rhynchospora pubera]|uniref:C2H2 type zinc finger protein n=1 Tax=Rhynchospora pubera TaxID=906938 RepID=A0AAV8FY65_9POAL|nr:C2H2 type zinc finger protein [Rhynchospora pubera]